MGSFVSWFAIFILSCSEVYVWSKFYSDRVVFKNILLYVSVIIMMCYGMFNYFYINTFIRIFLISALMSLCNWLIFKRGIVETIVNVLFCQFILAISELIFFIILFFILKIDLNYVQNSVIGTFFGNLVTCGLLIIIGNFSFVKSIYFRLVSFTSNLRKKYTIAIVIFFVLSINILMATIYYKLNFSFIIIVNFVLLLIYFYITYRIITERSINNLIKTENDSLMASLHQYEDMVDRQRVDNHENKNQLLIIKSMINKKDKDVIKYIDTIVKDQKEDDESLYTRVMTIPSGGLQGIIYQKMLVMKDEHIKFNLDVGRGVRDYGLDRLSIEDNYRLCKIIGVFLDNAIDESRNISDKCIMISLYVDTDLVIEVSNKFEGKLDIDRMDESGYTTKGDGHGYGLTLVKKILSETDTFKNTRSVKRNIFKQVIRIKNT